MRHSINTMSTDGARVTFELDGIEARRSPDFADLALAVNGLLTSMHLVRGQRELAAVEIERLLKVVRGLETYVDGTMRALIRDHAVAGGSYGDLATAIGVPRSTAQSRREAIMAAFPDADPAEALVRYPKRVLDVQGAETAE